MHRILFRNHLVEIPSGYRRIRIGEIIPVGYIYFSRRRFKFINGSQFNNQRHTKNGDLRIIKK